MGATLNKLRFHFPYFHEPVGNQTLDPPNHEPLGVQRRMGCDGPTANRVALHRRVIKALREAEETGVLHHVRELATRTAAGEFEDAALPVDFHKRLLSLHVDLHHVRPHNRPRSISPYRDREIRSRFTFYLQSTGNRRVAIDMIAEEFRLSEKHVESIVTGITLRALEERDGAEPERLAMVTNEVAVGTSLGRATIKSTSGGATYSLLDDADELFAIDPATGEVRVAAPLNREDLTSHTIRVCAKSADGSTSERTFAILMMDVEEPKPSAAASECSDGLDSIVNVFDPDFERFFAWAAALADPTMIPPRPFPPKVKKRNAGQL